MHTKRTKSLAAALLLLLAAGAALLTGAARAGEDADEIAIRQAVQYYFDGGTNADSNTLRKAFHPDARMLFVRDGKYVAMPIGEYITRSGTAKSPASQGTQKRVVSIDRTGNAAVARLDQRRPDGGVVVDYMSLLKVDGRWVIVNKIFDRQ